MGIIKAIGQAIGGTLADQWLEVIEADDMSDKTVFTSGVLIRKGQNTKGTTEPILKRLRSASQNDQRIRENSSPTTLRRTLSGCGNS